MSFDNVWAMWQDEEDSTPSPAIGFGGREKVKWNALKMAQYFEKKLFDAKWHRGFVVVNVRALSTQLTKWRNSGRSEEEVRNLIDKYMSDEKNRGQSPGWQDFLYRAEKIAATVAPTAPETRQRTEDELLDEAWELGTLEGFQKAFPDNPDKAQKYYEMYKER